MNTGTTPLARLLGDDLQVPLLGGGQTRYVNLDNAATTPPFRRVWDRLAEVMPWYGSIHRGAGFKSVVSTRLLEKSLATILRFSGGDPGDDMLVLGWNTTSCLNHLARRLRLGPDSVVLTSDAEHTSNILPWRKHARVLECRAAADGGLDYDHLESLLKKHPVKLVTVTGASNVTGAFTNVHRVARLSHQYGARMLVDAAQLVAHRKIDRHPASSPDHLDFVVYGAHKMYAPFGIGVLAAGKETFRDGWPDVAGGGTIRLIDGDEIVWSDLPERESGGTPNFPGLVALAEACEVITEIGFKNIEEHENALLRRASEKLLGVPHISVFRDLDPVGRGGAAVIPFSIRGYHHSLVAAVLGAERGIGVRAGHLCQFELIRRFLKITHEERLKAREDIKAGDRRSLYGVVRASCGLGTTVADIDALAEALHALVEGRVKGQYEQGLDGEYRARDWEPLLPDSEVRYAQPAFVKTL
jgi:selenocysteine lyase/cysteine desulfurase